VRSISTRIFKTSSASSRTRICPISFSSVIPMAAW
jgi:hypothetical protein